MVVLPDEFRAVDLGDAPARHAPHPERKVQGERAGGDGLHGHLGRLAQAHDASFAELLFELGQRHFEGFVFIQWFLLRGPRPPIMGE